jgi:hypothetical protein
VIRHGSANLLFGAFAVGFEVVGQVHLRHGLPRQPLVPQQGQNRVIEGRGGQFELAAVGQFAV